MELGVTHRHYDEAEKDVSYFDFRSTIKSDANVADEEILESYSSSYPPPPPPSLSPSPPSSLFPVAELSPSSTTDVGSDFYPVGNVSTVSIETIAKTTNDILQTSPGHDNHFFAPLLWSIVVSTIVVVIIIALVAVVVRYRRSYSQRRIRSLNRNYQITFRFTRDSNLILDEKKARKTNDAELTGRRRPEVEICPTSTSPDFKNSADRLPKMTVSTDVTTTNQLRPNLYPNDLFEQDSDDNASVHIEFSTFSAVNANFSTG